MATYAIGDIQGCYDEMRRLLDSIGFDPVQDRLWLVGDLVNRGPQSPEVLRYLRGLGERAISVLGNHDLHLLVVAAGVRKPHRGDTLDALLAAPDRDELLDWLRRQRLMHADAGYAMVHAGLLPQWSITQALALAREVEAALQGPDYGEFLNCMYGNTPAQWRDDLAGYDRLRVVVNAMTRLRLCTSAGVMDFTHKTGLADAPAGYLPWFDVPGRASSDTPVLFGHWAALGLTLRADVLGLDSGCVWGRRLTAVRLEDRRVFQCGCENISAGDPQ
ncbi:MAG: symmetrical bis(5'-nucleosyl)-tetraphosphatase [Burkholderiales bacterium]|jgi:bis(5'-nucleosyl)-tetraphosphatase (symmetrical)|nr:symmetrical bis(5'-nucleosyl)-tetraphosphatase [Burkholderiales bacterium]